MGIAAEPRQHITSTPGVAGGKPCIAGTRIRVQDVVVRTELGDSADDIVRAYPHITLADVHAALAYYYDNRQTIDEQIRQSAGLAARMKAQAGPGLIDHARRANGGQDDAPVPS